MGHRHCKITLISRPPLPQITYDFVHPFHPSDTPPHLCKTKWLYNERMLPITQNCISALSTFSNQSDSWITCYFAGFLCCQEAGEGFSLVCTLCPRCHASSPLKHQTTLFPEKRWEINTLQSPPKSLISLTSTFISTDSNYTLKDQTLVKSSATNSCSLIM